MMFKNSIKILLLALLLVIGAAACDRLPRPPGAPSVQTEAAEPQIEVDRSLISATGVVVPEQEAVLSVSSGGVVDDVLVKEGDSVSAGDVLVRLEGSEQQLAAVTAAEMELVNARIALQNLSRDTDLLAAQALQSAEAAERALEDLNNVELQQALAQKAVADAKKAVSTTERNVRYLQSPASQADIDVQKSRVVVAEDVLNNAKEDYAPYANKPEDNLTRANLLAKKAQAQQIYDAEVRLLNALQGTANEEDINVAQANYVTAQAQLLQAERDLQRALDGPEPGEVALLKAQFDKGNRDFETYSVGPDPDDVARAEARVAAAEDQLAAAQAALADLELTAPFDGIISAVYINSSEWVVPGSPVILLADLDHLQVETTDLGEIDVAMIEVGDKAMVTFDALPDLVLKGVVSSIAPKTAQGSGVNYPVVIELSEIPAKLRWGMTAFVDIDKE